MYMQAHTCIDEYMNISRLDAVCFEPILSEYDDIGASETDQVKRESESKKGEKYTGSWTCSSYYIMKTYPKQYASNI